MKWVTYIIRVFSIQESDSFPLKFRTECSLLRLPCGDFRKYQKSSQQSTARLYLTGRQSRSHPCANSVSFPTSKYSLSSVYKIFALYKHLNSTDRCSAALTLASVFPTEVGSCCDTALWYQPPFLLRLLHTSSTTEDTFRLCPAFLRSCPCDLLETQPTHKTLQCRLM